MNLKKETKQKLQENSIEPDLEEGQHFLVHPATIQKITNIANINKQDKILEIGPGTGNITREIARKADKVTGIEIDEKFKPILQKLPENVEIKYQDARKYIINHLIKSKDPKHDKIIGNIPYKISEPLMHCLNYIEDIEVTVLTAPKRFISTVKKNPIYNSFLKIQKIKNIPRKRFYPKPATNSTLVKIEHRPSYRKSQNDDLFVRRELYLQEDKKLKNGLKETLIRLHQIKHQEQLTQREARKIIEDISLNKDQLEQRIDNIPKNLYKKIGEAVKRRDI